MQNPHIFRAEVLLKEEPPEFYFILVLCPFPLWLHACYFLGLNTQVNLHLSVDFVSIFFLLSRVSFWDNAGGYLYQSLTVHFYEHFPRHFLHIIFRDVHWVILVFLRQRIFAGAFFAEILVVEIKLYANLSPLHVGSFWENDVFEKFYKKSWLSDAISQQLRLYFASKDIDRNLVWFSFPNKSRGRKISKICVCSRLPKIQLLQRTWYFWTPWRMYTFFGTQKFKKKADEWTYIICLQSWN